MSLCLPCAAYRKPTRACYCHTLQKAPLYQLVAAHIHKFAFTDAADYVERAKHDKAYADSITNDAAEKIRRVNVEAKRRARRHKKAEGGRCRGCVHCLKSKGDNK